MERLNKILAGALAKKGLSEAAKGAMVCYYADKWGNGRFTPISFSRGILKVSVSSAPAASEIQIQETELIDFINEKIGHKAVRQLRIMSVNQREENF